MQPVDFKNKNEQISLQVGSGGCLQARDPWVQAGRGLQEDWAEAAPVIVMERWLPSPASSFKPRWQKQMRSASTGAHLLLLHGLVLPAEPWAACWHTEDKHLCQNFGTVC